MSAACSQLAQIAFHLTPPVTRTFPGRLARFAKGFANSSNDCKGHVFASRGKFIANKLSGRFDIRRVQTTYEKRDGGKEETASKNLAMVCWRMPAGKTSFVDTPFGETRIFANGTSNFSANACRSSWEHVTMRSALAHNTRSVLSTTSEIIRPQSELPNKLGFRSASTLWASYTTSCRPGSSTSLTIE